MKRLLFLFLLLIPLFSFGQATIQLKHDTANVWVGQYEHPLNTLRARFIDTDSTLAIIGTDNMVFSAARKYNAYTDDAGTPFTTYAALKAWVRQYFFVDASMSDIGIEASQYTGWAVYQDTVYTLLTPYHLIADSKVTLPNRAHLIIDNQKPIDINTFYNKTDSSITGRNGDGLNVYVEFVVVPSGSTTYLQASIDIGGVIGELFTGVYTFPKGADVPQRISFSFAGYTLDTWQTNGAKVKVLTDGACDIYAQRYVLTRTHKAR